MTKAQLQLKKSYQAALKKCGFRSWTAANKHRSELIHKKIYGETFSDEEAKELDRLQKLTEKYTRYKTNDSQRKMIQKMDRMFRRTTSGITAICATVDDLSMRIEKVINKKE